MVKVRVLTIPIPKNSDFDVARNVLIYCNGIFDIQNIELILIHRLWVQGISV
jgi:hypothetical protein